MEIKKQTFNMFIFGIFLILLAVGFTAYSTADKMPKDTETEEEKALREHVTKKGGTEKPFDNKYWDEKRPGIYVDANTGKPLFSSLDKYDSGSGWPSFTKPIDSSIIQEVEDNSHGMKRTEVRTEESHLGHVFDDGPDGGERFCINSAALRFIPYEDLEKEGYGEYKKLFEKE